MAIMAAIIIHPSRCNYENHRANLKFSVQWSSSGGFGVLALLLAPTMPRLRGKPRRGAGWYAADSRRKRHGNFKRVVRLARQKRRRMTTVASSPPGTRVEEDPTWTSPQTSRRVRCSRYQIIGIPRPVLLHQQHCPAPQDSQVLLQRQTMSIPPAWSRRSHRAAT
jgi:hypothetical protein